MILKRNTILHGICVDVSPLCFGTVHESLRKHVKKGNKDPVLCRMFVKVMFENQLANEHYPPLGT